MNFVIPLEHQAEVRLRVADEQLARVQPPLTAEDLLKEIEDRLIRMLGDYLKGSPTTQAEREAVRRAVTLEHREDKRIGATAVVAKLVYPQPSPEGNTIRLQGGPLDNTVRTVRGMRGVYEMRSSTGAGPSIYTLSGYDLMYGHYVYTCTQEGD